MGGRCAFFGGCRSGVTSKFNARSGLVCLLGGVLDSAKRALAKQHQIFFVFCDNMPRDVVAGLLFWGVKLSKRSSSGSCMDGGTLFSFSMFWTAEDAFPGVLCRACCPFIHAVNNLCCLVVGANSKPLPITPKMGAFFPSGVAFSGEWFWFGLGVV